MNKNPTMKNASENISKILNPKKSKLDELREKHKKIDKEISNFIGDLK